VFLGEKYMANKKAITKIIIIVICFCVTFSIGLFIGVVFSQMENHFSTALRTFQYFYSEIENNFGIITQYDKEYEVVGGIYWKDMSFSIIMEDGVKTIRAYKYIY
jgi:flagellar basal body-associated protein FliL